MKKLPLLIVFGLFLAQHTLAGTITVTSLNDNGAGTLRDAIAAAAPNDTINFGVIGTIVLTNGELFINKNLIISGPGPGMLTVQRSTAAGTAEFRIFNIAAGTVAISGLAVNNGRAPLGGGILNEDVLILSNCVVIGNVATNVTGAEGKGGGIKNSRTGTLTVQQSVISSNAAAGGAFTGSGGGFYNDNTMSMTDSTIHGNVASGGAGALGGGMVNGFSATITNSSFRFNSATGDSGASGQMGVGGGLLNAGTLLLVDCTTSDNTVTGGAGTAGDGGSVRGGGIANGIGGSGSTVELQRCTVSGNIAMGGGSVGGNGGFSQGGGISGDIGSTTRMTNSTISGNTAKAGTGGTTFNAGGGIFGEASTVTTFYSTITSNTVPNGSATDGGGICVSNGSALEIKSTILAANSAMVNLFLDDSSSYDSSGFNLIGTTNGTVAPPGPNDQFNVSGAALNLGPLQNNGGPTFTHALLCGSIAIDAGASAGAPPTDQRGFSRIVGPDADVGSFESSEDTTPPTIMCPPDIMAGADPGQSSKSNVTYTATATDNCPGVSVTCSPPSGSTFPAGTNTVMCTATDASGNTASCNFKVIIATNSPPMIQCPADIVASTDPGQCSKSNVTFIVTVTNNRPGVIVSCIPPSGSTFPSGTNTVMCTATDASGNATHCSFLVIVQATPITIAFNVSADCPTNLLPPLPLQSNSMICLVAADNAPFSFYRAALSNVPAGFVAQNGLYPGWCVDYAGGLTTNEVYKPALLYLSHGPLPPQLQNPNWDRVNYILNHKQGGSFDIQAAIWHFIGGPVPDTDTRFVPLSSIASNIIADATVNGTGFVPGPGQISAVILDLGVDAQTNIIEVVCPRGFELCAGTNFTLCATVTGTGPLTFRWTKDGITVPGATSNCLTLTNVSAADAGQYCLEVTGACTDPATACLTIGVTNCGPSPAPRLRALAMMPPQDIEIKVDGELGRRYTIEASSDLVSWRKTATAVNTNGALRFVDPNRGDQRFYRVLMDP